MTTNLAESEVDSRSDSSGHVESIPDPMVLRISEDYLWNGGVFEEIASKLNFKGHRISSLKELIGFLSYHDQAPALIVIDKELLDKYDVPKLLDSLKILLQIKFQECQVKFAVRINGSINKQDVKSYKSIGVLGLVPRTGSFNYHLNLKAYDTLLRGEDFWPDECVIRSPGVSKKSQENVDGIHLTDRQLQVQKLLCERGLSNKAIARQLNISESTVKIHVSAILKRYAVRNRTQLALAAKNQARL